MRRYAKRDADDLPDTGDDCFLKINYQTVTTKQAFAKAKAIKAIVPTTFNADTLIVLSN